VTEAIAPEIEAPRDPELPEGVLAVRVGPGANCSSAGSAIDILFYGSAIVGALAVARAAAVPPRARDDDDEGDRDRRGPLSGGPQAEHDEGDAEPAAQRKM
jgi:hypothetical protein